MTRVVLVPGVLALLPEYAGLEDPVAELRAAALAAVGWLTRDVTVLADAQGERVAAHLLAQSEREGDERSFLVVANGSAMRTEKAPGHLDERAEGFDADLRGWLRGDGPPLDGDLGDELWASTTGFVLMAEKIRSWGEPEIDYDDAPYGVQYWVMRWTCDS